MANTVNKNARFRKNIFISFLLVALLGLLYVAIPGYNWAISEMAFRNKELIDKVELRRLNNNLPELTMDDKRYFKIANYWYLDYLKQKTPQDAVILLPPISVIDTTEDMKFMNSSEWVEYFIYPRLCIGEDEKELKPALYKKVTHVAVVNNWGYDKLSYNPNTHPKDAVFPIDSMPKKP